MANMKNRKQAGFTLIELVSILMLMSIIIVVIVNRMTLSDNEIVANLNVIKSHLRFAQSKAMSSSSNWYIHFETTPAQYTLFKEGDVLKHFPAETDDNMALESGITLTDELIAEPFVIFDSLGRPYLNTTGTPGTQLAAATTIITSSAGDIEIKPETGFIP